MNKAKGQCVYNPNWECDPVFRDWVKLVQTDKRKAFCLYCDKTIDISTMGKSALNSHLKSEKHEQNKSKSKRTSSIKSFFGPAPSSSSKINVPDQPDTHNVTPPTPSTSSSIPVHTFVTKDDMLRAEIIWTLKLITSHQSYHSSENTNKLFQQMFPDSSIAKQFACGERKSAYLTVFGLSEHFEQLLKKSILPSWLESWNRELEN